MSRNIWHQGYDDYYLHNMFATRFWSKEGFQITHPIYAILVGGLAKVFGCETKEAAVPILVMAQLASIEIGSRLFLGLNKDKEQGNKLTYLVLSFCYITIQPLILPGYIISPNSANGYISPTQLLCRPFTLLCIYIFFQMYQKKEYNVSKQLLLLTMMAISGYIKPLFLMAFVPSMGILLFIDECILIKKEEETFGKAVIAYIKKVWPFFFGGVILIIQYIQNINLVVPEDLSVGWGKDAPIRFGWMYAWKQVVPNVYINILLAYALPIVVLVIYLMNHKRDKLISEFMRTAIAYAVVSFSYISCLYQEGYATDLNFRNAWIVSFSYFYAVCVLLIYRWNNEYLHGKKEKNIDNVNCLKKWHLMIVDISFAGHMICGFLMIIKNYIK